MKKIEGFVLLLSLFFVGCGKGPHLVLAKGAGGMSAAHLTYYGNIKSIFIRRCGACHHPGAAIPNWQDYQTAFSLRALIYRKVVVNHTMPLQGSPESIAITPAERALIGDWIQNGAPEGNPSAAPSPMPTPTPTPAPAPGQKPLPPEYSSIGTLLNTECFSCHSNNGNPTSPIFPRLAGQHKSYLIKELGAFRDHQRSDPNAQTFMWSIAKPLSDQQIQLLAQYFSQQPAIANVTPTDAASIKRGKSIFQNGLPSAGVPACESCHGNNAMGNSFAPRLAGQNAGYIANQFAAFDNGQRAEATVMPTFSKNLTGSQVKDVANYLQSL